MPKGLRALIVVMAAAAVAVLPLAGGIVHAAPHAITEVASSMTEHGDCCDHGTLCERKKPDGCGSTAACVVKCTTLSATVTATQAASRLSLVGEKTNFVVESLGSVRDNPPSPPPRV
ncbi:MAG: hypothetical protein ACR2J1_09385 [Methyloceanibacter sp.]|uniref:hypothetical protein n=1 Tax=Methyloceanibacter sp. TaxID=1965321 RepID=UPI003D9AF0FE